MNGLLGRAGHETTEMLMSENESNEEKQDEYAEAGVYEQPGAGQQDSAQPLDHRGLDDAVSEGKKASEDCTTNRRTVPSRTT
jgi:hypothetical protein